MLAPVFDVRSIALVRVLQQRKFVAVSLWAASLAAAPTVAAWRGLISFLGWAAKVMHLLGPKNKTEIKTENPNAKATPKTNQIQVRFQFQIRFKMRIKVGDVCG